VTIRLLLGTFAVSAVVGGVATALARRVALAAGLVAAVRPDRLHDRERPYGGGLAIAATLVVVVGGGWAAVQVFQPGWVGEAVRNGAADHAPLLVRLAIGALLFFMIGVVDDRYGLPAVAKLVLQLVSAAVVVVGLGIGATVWLAPAWAAEVLSIAWIVVVVNAYNMLDHADGLAGSVGLVALVFFAVGQTLVGEWFVPLVAMATAGALAGFLVHNAPPARLFMGDAGTMTVGYLLAALTMAARYYFPEFGTTRLVVLVPVVVLAVPLADAVCVVASRLWQGRNPMRGDATSHLGHRLLARGAGPQRAAAWAALVTAVTGVASLLLYASSLQLHLVGWFLAGSVVVMMLLARRRGREARRA